MKGQKEEKEEKETFFLIEWTFTLTFFLKVVNFFRGHFCIVQCM